MFCGDCIMAAVHIINRLPTPILENKTPYEALIQIPPAYDHLKVFGCLAFASNPSFPTDKFAHKGASPICFPRLSLTSKRIQIVKPSNKT